MSLTCPAIYFLLIYYCNYGKIVSTYSGVAIVKKFVANLLATIIHFVGWKHIRVNKWLNQLEQENINVWKRNILWLVKLYAKVLPYNKEKDGGNGV